MSLTAPLPPTPLPGLRQEESDTAPSHFLHHVDSIKIFEKEEYTKEHLPHHHHHHPHPSPLAAQVRHIAACTPILPARCAIAIGEGRAPGEGGEGQ